MLTTKYQYRRSKRGNLLLQIRMQSSEKLNNFCYIFTTFFESTLNFEFFERNYESYNVSISEIIDSKKRAYLNALKFLVLKTLQCERVNESQKLLKSSKKYFYNTFS